MGDKNDPDFAVGHFLMTRAVSLTFWTLVEKRPWKQESKAFISSKVIAVTLHLGFCTESYIIFILAGIIGAFL